MSLRTRAELATVEDVQSVPRFGGQRPAHFVFFADKPPAGILNVLDLQSLLPEACTLIGSELYIYLPNGLGRAILPTTEDG